MFDEETIKEFNEAARIETIRESCRYLFQTLYDNNTYIVKKAKLHGDFSTIALIYTETEGVTGGSCWDESNHYDYAVSDETLIKSKKNEYLQLLSNEKIIDGLGIEKDTLYQWIEDKVNQESRYSYIGNFFKHEYYGNCTTLSVYQLDTQQMILDLCSEEIQHIYHEIFSQFIPVVDEKTKITFR